MKKVAIIADGWKRYVNYAWILGCKNYIKKHNLEVSIDVFQCFGNFSKDELYNIGEYNIINLPDLKEYDGIILEITNVSEKLIYETIVNKVLESGVPAVSLLDTIPGMYRAGIDNYGSMRMMVEHLIKEHDCKTLNYIGGPEHSYENKSRQRAYEDVLRENGIEVQPERIYGYNFEVETGINAFRSFEKSGYLADAFVCANENIAVGLCEEAMRSGYKVPEDFCITGFDYFDKAPYFKPRITTVGYSKDDVSYEAMRILHRLWEGKDVSKIVYAGSYPVFQESCGCVNKNPKSRSQYIKDQIFSDVREIDLYNGSMDMNRNILKCQSYTQMAEYLVKCLVALKCDEIYLLMNSDIVESAKTQAQIEEKNIVAGFSQNMEAVIAYKNGDTRYNVHKAPDELLPDIWKRETDDVRVFLPLHIREREVGYFVLVNCDYMMSNHFVHETLSSFTKSFEYMYSNIMLRKYNEKLSKMYIEDSLTGLYNRMAYNELAIPLFEECMHDNKPLAVVFMDADHLKRVNDEYGHDMGNVLIRGIADGIRKCFPKDAISMRYGGDEFVVLVPDCESGRVDAMLQNFYDMITLITKTKTLPFQIEASVGYTIAREGNKTIDYYINIADEKMYSAKKQRKAERK